MSMQLSVAICTRNPRKDYLARVFAALRAQTLSTQEWELVLVDSASDQPLPPVPGELPYVATHTIRLEQSGLLRARLAAIRVSSAPVMVFLDDDNVPAEDFLETGLRIGRDWPNLGCWGPGRIIPECETPAPATIAGQFGRMACCDIVIDRWSNTLDVVPPGAGLFVRRRCAVAYSRFAEQDTRRQMVGETADRFFRGDDTDLVFHIVKTGLGAGQFRSLQIAHLMPTRRLTEDYVVTLARVAAGSALVINHLWGNHLRPESLLDWTVYQLKSLRFSGLDRRIARAHRAGEADARRLLAGESS